MKSYRVGELSERVALKRPVLARDDSGGAVRTLQDLATVWAMVRPLTGREREQAERTDSVADYLVVVRARSDLQAKDVIVWRSRTLNIRFIRDAGPQPLFLEIEAAAGEPA